MRRLLLIYVLLYILSQSVSAKEACALIIHLSSGKQLVCLLDERPVVTFTDEEVVLTTHMHEVRYQSVDVQKFTYTNVVVDGIQRRWWKKDLSELMATTFVLVVLPQIRMFRSIPLMDFW